MAAVCLSVVLLTCEKDIGCFNMIQNETKDTNVRQASGVMLTAEAQGKRYLFKRRR